MTYTRFINFALVAMIQKNRHTFTMLTNFRYWGIAVLALFTCLLPSQDIFAQGIADLGALQGGGDGGGGIGGLGGGGIGGGGIGGGDSGIGDIGNAFNGGQIEDLRNQGFVGATAERIQGLGFVGPPGETSGPPLADGASIGGGVNDGGAAAGGGAAGGGFGGGGGGGNNQQNGFGGIGQGKGFQVVRKGVRTALTPRFASPTRTTRQISTRFTNRIRRQPNMANDGGGMLVSINGRVATVSGFAQSEAERSRFIRQLRLEPGIDRIVDQVGSQ